MVCTLGDNAAVATVLDPILSDGPLPGLEYVGSGSGWDTGWFRVNDRNLLPIDFSRRLFEVDLAIFNAGYSDILRSSVFMFCYPSSDIRGPGRRSDRPPSGTLALWRGKIPSLVYPDFCMFQAPFTLGFYHKRPRSPGCRIPGFSSRNRREKSPVCVLKHSNVRGVPLAT